MTNTEANVPTAEESTSTPERKTLSIPVPSLKLGKLTSLIVVALVAVAVTAGAFLLWGPHNPILAEGQHYKVPGGTLSITHEDSTGTFTPFANPQYVYSTLSPGTWKCLADKGYAGVQAAFGMNAQIMIVDAVDYYACS
jgi:hypothetical protein